jgi:hypothetical protein
MDFVKLLKKNTHTNIISSRTYQYMNNQQQQQQNVQPMVEKFVQACTNFSNTAVNVRQEAERFLLQMENQSQPYEFCRAVLGMYESSFIEYDAHIH